MTLVERLIKFAKEIIGFISNLLFQGFYYFSARINVSDQKNDPNVAIRTQVRAVNKYVIELANEKTRDNFIYRLFDLHEEGYKILKDDCQWVINNTQGELVQKALTVLKILAEHPIAKAFIKASEDKEAVPQELTQELGKLEVADPIPVFTPGLDVVKAGDKAPEQTAAVVVEAQQCRVPSPPRPFDGID